MSPLAILVYAVAFCFPVYLLFRHRSQAWYLHVLAVAVGMGLGFLPTPEQLKSTTFDLVFGGVFTFLMVWGIGGLVVYRPHRTKHA